MGILRTYLALAVVFGHVGGDVLGFQPLGGAFAVRLFYVISGFYMALVLDTKYGTGLQGTLLFWRNRYLRLAPSYWVVLVLALALAVKTEPSHPVLSLLPSMSVGSIALVAVTSVTLLGQDALMFVGFDPSAGERSFHFAVRLTDPECPGHRFLLVPQAWTLGVELLFYLVVPLLARQRSAVLAALVLGSLALRAALYAVGAKYDPWSYRFFPTELALFLAGMLSYRLYRRFEPRRWSRRVKWAVLASFAALVLLAGHQHRLALPILACFPFVLPVLFDASRLSAIDGRIGELSYPVYISHMLFKSVGDGRPLLACALAIAFAVLLLVLVEHPIDRYRQRWARERRAASIQAQGA